LRTGRDSTASAMARKKRGSGKREEGDSNSGARAGGAESKLFIPPLQHNTYCGLWTQAKARRGG
jgi:hypothetical protein